MNPRLRLPSNLLLLVLLACGGGGGGGGTNVAGGGIGGSGISSGPVTAFGSRVVTGTSWDVDDAEITSDGRGGFGEDDLALGVVTLVEGTRSQDGLTGRADRVDFDNRIRGRVQNVNPGPVAGQTRFEVFGVSIVASGSTFLEPAGLTLSDGIFVNVYGLVGVDGVISATRIEGQSTDDVDVKGFVENFDGDEFDLDLGPNQLVVKLDDGAPCGPLTELEPAGLQIRNGDFVEVSGFEIGSDELCADRVELEPGAFGEDEDDVEIDGIVTDFVSLADFRVDGVPVDASAAQFFPPSLATSLEDDDRVEVAGDITGGVLRAESVQRVDQQVGIKAAVDAIDVTGGILTLLGVIEVEVDGDTEFSGESSDLAGIDPGDFLEIEAVQTSDGLLATEVDDKGTDVNDVDLSGPVEAIDDQGVRGLTVLGVDFVADEPDTEFEGFDEDEISADRFYERIRVGDFVEATDCTVPPTDEFDVACEVELDD